MKKIAVLTGVAMLVAAAVVVAQTGVIFTGPEMRGQMLGNPAGETCDVRIVNGIVQECCETSYSPFYTCRHFSDAFDRLCEEAGMDFCEKVDVHCPKTNYHHRINETVIDGEYCLVEPQREILTRGRENYHMTVCSLAGQHPSDCDCRIENMIDEYPEDFTQCALTDELLRVADEYPEHSTEAICEACCYLKVKYHERDPRALQWHEQCQTACNAVLEHEAPCPTGKECVQGYASTTCDKATCLQPFNSGKCDENGECIIIDRTCVDSSRACSNPTQPDRPQTSSSSSSSLRSSSSSSSSSSSAVKQDKSPASSSSSHTTATQQPIQARTSSVYR